ncbi:MAG TPA: right-handed parallel beta-helix repeat-containing protein [Solirubrobacteraceae bacterium]|nr:right-handed parallel beta-helix repeat-containing protein [Solirubrobacteraceae bacterium]
MSRRVARALAVTASALCVMAAAASAAEASKVWVSNSAPAVAGGRSCSEPGFNTVQAAVNSGAPMIEVCSGTYTEQVEIAGTTKIVDANGAGTATLAMPATPSRSESACDTKANESEGPLDQSDEISICTGGTVTIMGIDVEAVIPIETCAIGLNGIFIGGGGTLKATHVSVNGASSSLAAFKGCQQGIAVRVGSASREEVGHAQLKSDAISGYEKNGPTVSGAGSTMVIKGSTITGEGASPYTAQNGVQISFGGQGTVENTTISGNECNVEACGPQGSQGAGVLFYEAAAGSKLMSSTVSSNDMGVYYASGSATVPASPDVTVNKVALNGNRYEGVALEEGKALLTSDTIMGPGRVGIALYQFEGALSASESSASKVAINGQSEAAIKVESDKQPGDIPGKFTIAHSTHSSDGATLINESNNFEVIFS